jgi:hypothetical protein
MATTKVAVGESCPTCGRRIPKPRVTTTSTTSPHFPVVTPASGAEPLLADHLDRRSRRARSGRRGRYEHPDDYRLRSEHPELVAFLREAAAGGCVTRFYSAPEPGHVVIELAGAFGVFHPISAVTLDVATLEALAPRIADGTAWNAFRDETVAA